MKHVIAIAGKVSVVDVPPPICGDGDILVETAYSVISTGTETWTINSTEPIGAQDILKDGTKLAKAKDLIQHVWKTEGLEGIIDYTKMVRNPQVPLGYSVSGVVKMVGRNIPDIVPGERVACVGEGKATHAEMVAVPRNLVAKIPDRVDLQDASFAALGAIALQGFRRSGLQVGETVVVIGVGLVGNLVSQIARAAGCRVAAIDMRTERLNLIAKLGAELTVKLDDPDLDKKLNHFTRGRGADAAIICAATTNSDPVNLAAKLVRDRGTLVVVGRVGLDFDRKALFQKELQVFMSRSLGPGRYDPIYEERGVYYPFSYVRWTLNRNIEGFLDLVAAGEIHLKELVANIYPIDKAEEAYRELSVTPKAAVLLSYGKQSELNRKESTDSREIKTYQSGRPKIAVVGPGNFAKETLIPLLKGSGIFRLGWLVSSNPVHAKQLAQRFRFESETTNFADVLSDDETIGVFITTPNNLHHQMVVAAARAGKAVFVEKPLCLNEVELRDIQKAQTETGSRIVVGFNRRYSPLILRLKAELDRLNGPFMVTYRVIQDFTPLSKWVQDPLIGGGRIIAECGHFFDTFNFLLGQFEPKITVNCANINGSSTVARDNFVATLNYPDGSVATLIYTALGNRRADRERIEVFAQGKVMVLNDFRDLTIYDQEGNTTVKESAQDKGHRREFEAFAELLQGKSTSVITLEEAVAATRISFEVEKLARGATPETSTD